MSSAGYDVFKRTKYFGSLNGLRAISIIAVIWHHTASSSFSAAIAGQGFYGVTLFFVISGFLITTLLLREKEHTGSISLGGFYVRRILRIFPLYYTVIAAYCVATMAFEGSSRYGAMFFENLKYFLTYTSNWFVNLSDDRVIFYFAWSLATEEQFYFLWPSVERFLKRRHASIVAVAMIVVSMVASRIAHGMAAPVPFFLVVASSISTAICLGVLLAHALDDAKVYAFAAKILGRRFSSAAALLLSAGILFAAPYLGLEAQLLVPLCFTVLVGSCVIREDHCLAKAFAFKPLDWIGTVSYGVYLLHMLSANVVKKLLPGVADASPAAYFGLSAVVAIGVASVSYKYYESRFLALKGRFARAH
jgi:peptidoglycan/LPS O-acetylase OafA/YrhL